MQYNMTIGCVWVTTNSGTDIITMFTRTLNMMQFSNTLTELGHNLFQAIATNKLTDHLAFKKPTTEQTVKVDSNEMSHYQRLTEQNHSGED